MRVKKGPNYKGAHWTPTKMVDVLLRYEDIPGPVWEPACGSGRISSVLERAGYKVYSSDLKNYGYPGTRIHDFMMYSWGNFRPRFRSIITNPPYIRLHDWTMEACRHKRSEFVAMLMPASSLGDAARVHEQTDFRLTRLILFRRPPKFTGPDGTADVNWGVAWFVFRRGEGHDTNIHSVEV